MSFSSGVSSLLVCFVVICVTAAVQDRLAHVSSFIEQRIGNGIIEKTRGWGVKRDLSSKWPFFSSPDVLPNRKPPPQFGKPGKPKPPVGPQQVWSWNNDDKGWSSIGWINMQTGCTNSMQSASMESTTTVTEFITSYETETVTEGPGNPTTITVAPPSSSQGWTSTSTVFYTELETTTSWETQTTTLESTSIVMEYETSVISTTVTETSSSIISSTSTVYSIVTATTYSTSGITVLETSTIMETSTPDPPLHQIHIEATMVLDPSVYFYETTSTITRVHSETPTLTKCSTYTTSVTTGIDVVTEFVEAPFSTTPPITITQFVATSLNITVDTETWTVLSNSPTCTVTEYTYLTTETIPLTTVTASQCGNPCGGGANSCLTTCTPKVSTTTLDVTSTSIATALQPITVTYAATETVTKFTYDESILVTTHTTAVTKSPSRRTITSTQTLPLQVSTVYTTMTTSTPVRITTEHNLCTTTRYETCTTTSTMPPVYLTLIETKVVGIAGTVTQTSTNFTAPPVPTVTSLVQGGINTITATKTTTIITDSAATTTTLTQNCTTIGVGETTITPTKTVIHIKTTVLTTTPVVTATKLKSRTLVIDEYRTAVSGTTESVPLEPSSIVNDWFIIEVTPTPSIVTVSTIIMQMEKSIRY